MKKILVTGSAGFIGSNFVPFLLNESPQIEVISLDKLTYAGNLKNLKEVENHPRHRFIRGDIGDRALVEKIFKDQPIQGVIHFAAESHVDNSIEGPETFIQTNVNGTFTLLDAAKNAWMEKPFTPREAFQGARFHHISTDEVFGSLGPEGSFTESTPYAPNSPYSASKASSDLILRSYHRTYGLNTVLTNCSNNYGPKQHLEKLIPTVIRKAINSENIPIYGNGQNIRDWLYVEDHCRAIWSVFSEGRSGESYNVGGGEEYTNIELAKKICSQLDQLKPRSDGNSYAEQITFVEDRPGHDARYSIDPSKIEREIGFKPQESFESGLQKTILWYLDRL